MSATTYPVRVEGRLDAPLSRWLWLVKWFLAIPHFVVLAFLWPVFALFSVFAFFAILATGRYPRALFDFNLGVMRWSWRVAYYSYGALATDRYPPFTLADDPSYPARLDVPYPEHLSRGLVLVKWWLLALPHYLVVALFAGGAWFAWNDARFAFGGLIGILVFIAAVTLAFTGTYPRSLFDFVLGLNRWVLRVSAYAGLMTDEYPPFRLDTGGEDGSTLTVPPKSPEPPRTGGWTGGRVTAVVVGSLLLLGSGGLATGGAMALWADRTQRDADGFLMTGNERFATPSYAIVSDTVELERYPSGVLGDVRVRVRSGAAPVFTGIARTSDVLPYLAAFEHATVTDWRGSPEYTTSGTGAPVTPPGEASFWVASATGAGTTTLDWAPEDGEWSVVVMNADASRDVSVRAAVGAEAPALGWVAFGLFLGAVLLAVPGTALVAVAVKRAGAREGK